MTRQLDLFSGGAAADANPEKSRRAEPLAPARFSDEVQTLGAHLPDLMHVGTSSWTFPGWAGIVFDRAASQARLVSEGLRAYAQHPVLRTVGIDRTFYGPVDTRVFAEWAAAVPEHFRFLVKAHEACTLGRFPSHPRYGARKGQDNELFLDPVYATDAVIGPFVEGLGTKAGPLVFQFPPQDLAPLGGPLALIDRLHAFLTRLPVGPLYAVEVRNAALLTVEFAAAMKDAGAAPVVAIWNHLPPVNEQARLTQALEGSALVVRWMLPPHLGYDEAKAKYEPFDRLVEEDLSTRESLAKLATKAMALGKPVYVTINNKAEGSAPLSALKLAESVILERITQQRIEKSTPG